MSASSLRNSRILKFHPGLASMQRLLQGASHALGRGAQPVRMLLVSDGKNYTSEQQFAPLSRHAELLRRRLGLVFEHRLTGELAGLRDAALRGFDVVGIKLCFREPAAHATAIVADLARRLRPHGIPLVYFDGDDDLNVQWPAVLDLVDLYVKKHLYADRREYLKPRIGKSNLTDYVAREHGRSFADDPIPGTPALDPAALDKLHLGWNIGLDDKIVDLAAKMPRPAPEGKTIDIATRAVVPPEAWTYPLRSTVVDRIAELERTWRVLAPRDRVSQEQYYQEMLGARICVSPFGYGELCWRDFEAILCGCLLVKPDMSHVETAPDIFVPGETYAPVRWDYANLGEVCARYLADEPARRRVADRAYEVLRQAMQGEAFVEVFARVLHRVLPRVARPSRAAA